MTTTNDTTSARIVYTSPDGRVRVEREGRADFVLYLDGQYNSPHRSQTAAEVAGLVWLEEQATELALDLADEAADAARFVAQRDRALLADVDPDDSELPYADDDEPAYDVGTPEQEAQRDAENAADMRDFVQTSNAPDAPASPVLAAPSGPTAPTLHEALAARGYTSANEGAYQRRAVYTAEGVRVGSFDAHEAWRFLASLDAPSSPTGHGDARVLFRWDGKVRELTAFVAALRREAQR